MSSSFRGSLIVVLVLGSAGAVSAGGPVAPEPGTAILFGAGAATLGLVAAYRTWRGRKKD